MICFKTFVFAAQSFMLPKVMVRTKGRYRKYRTMALGFTLNAVLQKSLIYVVLLQFYKTKQFVVCRNFRVISMRFAVFLCFSVHCLHVFLCIVPTPLRSRVIFKCS